MTDSGLFALHEGELPLLISVPHDGRRLPADIEAAMTPAARALPDTDWHVARLYEFAKMLGAGMLVAGYSRYVVDLNRSCDDQALYAGQPSTGLCPARTFAGEPIYADGRSVSTVERDARAGRYWRPYHDAIRQQIERIRARYGYALLWDAHSIAGEVPRLFDGELPVLNIGTNAGQSCTPAIERAVSNAAERSPFSCVVNGRFRGGYITRHYGDPENGCYAIQLELSQRCYMDEVSLRYDPQRAAVLVETLRKLLQAFVDTAAVPGSDT